MDVQASTLIAGMLVSTVGFSVFLYGKKQARVPQLITGMVLMALPLLVTDALWMSLAGCAATGSLWLAVKSGH